MPKVKDIAAAIESFAPLSSQEAFDNSGLICGDPNQEVTGVLITLDTTESTVKEAVSKGCNLIIEHHPTIFIPVRSVNCAEPQGRVLRLALGADVAIYAAHTNIDYAEGGLNDKFLQNIGCQNVKRVTDKAGSARIGKLKSPVSLQAFAEQTAKILKDKRVSFVGEPQKTVLTVAGINGGGGSQQEEIAAAFAAGADVFITADFKYHVLRWGAEQGYPLVSAGHYETEIHFIDLMYEILQAKGYRNILFKSQTAQTPWA